MNTEELMQKAIHGDQNAFSLLYTKYYIPVYRYIYSRLRNKEDAEDAAQNVFLKVFRRLSEIKQWSGNPESFFIFVARNHVIDFLRSKKSKPMANTENSVLSTFKDDSISSPTETLERIEKTNMLFQMIDLLQEEEKEILQLKFFSELNSKEIGLIVGKSPEAVRKLISRAIERLRHTSSFDTFT